MNEIITTNRFSYRLQKRTEDVEYRKLQNLNYEIDCQRYFMDAKYEVLRMVGEISAYIAVLVGFMISALCEINIPPDLGSTVFVIFGITCTTTICLMLITCVTCTFLLVAIFNDEHKKYNLNNLKFFWSRVCYPDWELGFKVFNIGALFFLVSLIPISVTVSWDHPSLEARAAYAGCMSAVALSGVVVWYRRVYEKWVPLLTEMIRR